MTHTYPVSGFPIIVIPYLIFEKCMGWMQSTHSEVSWRGLADWDEKSFTVKEVFLPVQESDGAYVNVQTAAKGGDVGKWLTQCVRNGTYQNADGKCRYKWHMHKHPGKDWSSLYESTQDEDNTDKYGIRVETIDWMMVGRAVDTGKFCVCLEIFRPVRLSIDYLPVFVDYDGSLFLVSEPNKKPHLSSDAQIQAEDIRLFSHDTCRGQITVEEIKIPPLRRTNYTDNLYDFGASFGFDEFTSLTSYKSFGPRIERTIKVSALTSDSDSVNPVCTIKRLNGILSLDLHIQVGPWNIGIENIEVPLRLPQEESIRKEASAEVAEKVTLILPPPKVKGRRKLRSITRKKGALTCPVSQEADSMTSSLSRKFGTSRQSPL